MKIMQSLNNGSNQECKLSDAIEGTVEYEDEGGSIEGARHMINEQSKIIGVLADVLLRHNLLTTDDVSEIIGYRYSVED